MIFGRRCSQVLPKGVWYVTRRHRSPCLPYTSTLDTSRPTAGATGGQTQKAKGLALAGRNSKVSSASRIRCGGSRHGIPISGLGLQASRGATEATKWRKKQNSSPHNPSSTKGETRSVSPFCKKKNDMPTKPRKHPIACTFPMCQSTRPSHPRCEELTKWTSPAIRLAHSRGCGDGVLRSACGTRARWMGSPPPPTTCDTRCSLKPQAGGRQVPPVSLASVGIGAYSQPRFSSPWPESAP